MDGEREQSMLYMARCIREYIFSSHPRIFGTLIRCGRIRSYPDVSHVSQ